MAVTLTSMSTLWPLQPHVRYHLLDIDAFPQNELARRSSLVALLFRPERASGNRTTHGAAEQSVSQDERTAARSGTPSPHQRQTNRRRAALEEAAAPALERIARRQHRRPRIEGHMGFAEHPGGVGRQVGVDLRC